eukprot:gene4519-3306_t
MESNAAPLSHNFNLSVNKNRSCSLDYKWVERNRKTIRPAVFKHNVPRN